MHPRTTLASISLAWLLMSPALGAGSLTGEQVQAALKCDVIKKATMPPFTSDFSKVNDAFYKIEFMEDNYPGQKVDGKLYAHPLYGTYVLKDYVQAYRRARTVSGKSLYRKAIADIARSAICHMEVLKNGGLAAYYYYPYIEPRQEKFYSALTQAQYLPFIYDAGTIVKNPALIAAAELIARSLELQQKDGGVVFQDSDGNFIPEEYPGDATHPPQFVLNGWMDTIIWLDKYRSKSKSRIANILIDRFGAALERIVRKYDAPAIANSLYKLSEVGQINFVDFIGGELEVQNARVVIPGIGAYSITLSDRFADKSYKSIFFGPAATLIDGNIHLSNNANAWLWLSLFPPEGNIIELDVRATRDSRFLIRLSTGKPLMKGGGKTDYEWLPLTKEIGLAAGETIHLRIPVTNDAILKATQPVTSFKPMVVGKTTRYVNVYHYGHASQLCQLSSISKMRDLRKYSIAWEEYTRKWKFMSIYSDPKLDLRRSDIVLGLKGNFFYSCLAKQLQK